jgi:hypothetical protein
VAREDVAFALVRESHWKFCQSEGRQFETINDIRRTPSAQQAPAGWFRLRATEALVWHVPRDHAVSQRQRLATDVDAAAAS